MMKIFVAEIARDEKENDFYLDLSEYGVETVDRDGSLTDIWIPYVDYYDVVRPPKPDIEKKNPEGT